MTIAIAIVIPSRPLTKEWAYAGITFLLTGAIVSHLAVGHSWLELLPAVMLLALSAASWSLRPSSRRIAGRAARPHARPVTTDASPLHG